MALPGLPCPFSLASRKQQENGNWQKMEMEHSPSSPCQAHVGSDWHPRWFSGKESACKYRRYKRCWFYPGIGKIPWSSIQFSCSVMPDSFNPMDYSMPGFPVHHQLLELVQTHVHWVGDAIQPSHPLSSASLPAFYLSQHQGLFQLVSSSNEVTKVLELQLQHNEFNKYSGLISFRTDWLDLLAVQGTLKSLFQHYSSKASILWHSAFFIVQLLHPYMTTGKTITLTRQTFVGKVMSLLFTMLSRLVLAFLPRSKCLLISCLQSPSAVILKSPKIKSLTVSTVSPSISHEVMGPDAMILVFWMFIATHFSTLAWKILWTEEPGGL